jgi:hypothetical protein
MGGVCVCSYGGVAFVFVADKYPAKLMVTGAICARGKLPLIVYEQGLRMDAKDYLCTLDQVCERAKDLYSGSNFVIMDVRLGAWGWRAERERMGQCTG